MKNSWILIEPFGIETRTFGDFEDTLNVILIEPFGIETKFGHAENGCIIQF